MITEKNGRTIINKCGKRFDRVKNIEEKDIEEENLTEEKPEKKNKKKNIYPGRE